jgi:hypothetical protein
VPGAAADGGPARTVVLRDRLSDATYERDGTELVEAGLYLDVGPWGYHAFEIGIA